MVDKSCFLKSRLLEYNGCTAIFSQRCGGVSPPPFDSLNLGLNLGDQAANVEKNLAILIEAAALKHMPHQARQRHGFGLIECSGPGRQHKREADILLTREPDCLLAVRVADCLPLILADPVRAMVAVVHAGWRGTVQGIAARAVQAMCRLGSDAGNIRVALGPSIGACCFSIGSDVRARLAQCCPGAGEYSGPETADLAAINMLQLSLAGIPDHHMDHLRACTYCQPELFFSHRRDQGHSGRQMAIAGLMRTA